MGRRVANTSVGPKPSSTCPNWAKSPKVTLADLAVGPLLALRSETNCVIIAEKTSIRTTIAIPVRIDSLYANIHHFDNGAQERHNLLKTILKLRSKPSKGKDLPNEVFDMIEEQMHKPSRGTREELYNRMHHMFRCMLGTCAEGYHTITSPQFNSFVKSFHMDCCKDPAYYGRAKVDLFQDLCGECARYCKWADCTEEFGLTYKHLCCNGECCACSETADENEDSDDEDEDDCSCFCQCECTCECWCDHECWRNDEDQDLQQRMGCRGQDGDYVEQLLGYIKAECKGKHQVDGDDSEHAETHLEDTKRKVEKKMKLVDEILMRRFGLKLHIVYSGVGETAYEDRLFQIVPLAFLYDPKIDNFETIDTPPEAQDLGTEPNYYANAATLVPEPEPEATSESDSKLHQEAITKLKHAMEVLDLKPDVHPMQIQPFEFSTCTEKCWFYRLESWKVADDRANWVCKARKMEFPRWMTLRSMEYASAE